MATKKKPLWLDPSYCDFPEIVKKNPEPTPLHTVEKFVAHTGRNTYLFSFKEIKGNELILAMEGGELFSALIPPHWEDVQLLEPNTTVELTTCDKSVVPSIKDAYTNFYQFVPGLNDKIFVPWRNRNFIFLQPLPEQYYEVYSTISDKNFMTYNYSIKSLEIQEIPKPFRLLGYAPLVKHNTKYIKAMPFMCKKT